MDWAAFFGVKIGEIEFQNALPITDNPNTGYVGSPTGERGWIPPNSYGVHAAPVAALLQQYGLQAQSVHQLAFEDLQREIAAGQPVIVWVIGNTWSGVQGISYTASDGETLIVAPYEHTVIVIGYTPQAVTVIDGNMIYSAATDQFLDSWSVLGYQAVIMK